MSTVWVAFVNTRYEVMAVAETEQEAIRLACVKAYEFLYDREALTSETDTVAKVQEWFGVTARPVQVGAAVLLD